MEFDVVIKTIREICNIRLSRDQFVINLFEKAGAREISAETVASWFKSGKGKRNPDFTRHFYESINEAGVIDFFKYWVEPYWKELLREFHKINNKGTISCDTEDEFYRYLLYQFLRFLNVMPKEPIFLKDTPIDKSIIFGREAYLEEIACILKSSNYVAITGIGGIGKSRTALSYAYGLQCLGNWVIQHVMCEDSDSLREAVARLQFDGLEDKDENTKFDSRIKALKDCRQPTLIIFDNLNRRIEPNDHDDFKKLKGCSQHIKFIIISRDTKVVGDDRQNLIKIKPLEIVTLLELYKYYRFEEPDSHTDYIAENKVLLTELFGRVCCHTLAIELLAKLSRNSNMDENKIYEKLETGFNVSPEVVCIIKDDKALEDNILEIIKTIFTMSSSINDIEKDILRHLAIVPTSGMEISLFKELFGYKRDGEIIRLRDRSWITMDEKKHRIWLHPLVCEVICNEDTTKPSKEACSVFIGNLSAKLEKTVKYSREWHVLNKTYACYLLKALFPSTIGPYLPYLKDEYQSSIFNLNKSLIKYLDADSPELSKMQSFPLESDGKLSNEKKQ